MRSQIGAAHDPIHHPTERHTAMNSDATAPTVANFSRRADTLMAGDVIHLGGETHTVAYVEPCRSNACGGPGVHVDVFMDDQSIQTLSSSQLVSTERDGE